MKGINVPKQQMLLGALAVGAVVLSTMFMACWGVGYAVAKGAVAAIDVDSINQAPTIADSVIYICGDEADGTLRFYNEQSVVDPDTMPELDQSVVDM